MASQTVIDRLALIQRAPLDKLRDPYYLECELLPALGLYDEAPRVYPEALHPYLGGLRSWQYPGQFAPYLADLADRGIQSYLEIGTRYGGTFMITVEYLRRFNPVNTAIAIDPHRAEELADYIHGFGLFNFRYINADSHGWDARRAVDLYAPFDLALIDGDHSPEGFGADWLMVKPYARTIAVHDMDNDGYPHIREWFERYSGEKKAYRRQYPDVEGSHAGIGVVYA